MTTPTPATVDHSPSSPPAAPSMAVNLDIDYGTPNCLFLYYLPLVHESKKEELIALQKEIHAWHAYELGRAEELVRRRIDEKALSSDDSPGARVRRTNYRAKIIQNLRECRELWAPVLNRHHSRSRMKIKKADLNAAIRREILSYTVRSDSAEAQFSIILKMVDFIVASNPYADHRYWFTHTHFVYDSEYEAFLSHFNTMSFRFIIEDPAEEEEEEIECQEEPVEKEGRLKEEEHIGKKRKVKDQDQEDPILQKEKDEGREDAKQQDEKDEDKDQKEEDLIGLQFWVNRYSSRFYRDTWEETRPMLESKPHYFEEGEKIRKEMSVEFVVTE